MLFRSLLAAGGVKDEDRIVRAYRLVLGRAPADGERQVALTFLRGAGDQRTAWAAVLQSLFASADFRYVD